MCLSFKAKNSLFIFLGVVFDEGTFHINNHVKTPPLQIGYYLNFLLWIWGHVKNLLNLSQPKKNSSTRKYLDNVTDDCTPNSCVDLVVALTFQKLVAIG